MKLELYGSAFRSALILILVQVCSITIARAFEHTWTEMLSDNHSVNGWTLSTDIGISGINGNPQWTYGTDVSLAPFTPMDSWMYWTPPYAPIYVSPSLARNPDTYNGYTFAWSWSDGAATFIQKAVAAGIRKVGLSYGFEIVSGGAHPTIRWSNDDTIFSQYRIRILDPNSNRLLYEVSLNRSDYGQNPVYKINGYTFVPGINYIIRIEARQYSAPASHLSPDGVIPMILNRSTLLVNYNNTRTFSPQSLPWLELLLSD